MSTVMTETPSRPASYKAELRLPYSLQYSRTLYIELSAGGFLWVQVRSKKGICLSSTNVQIEKCYLDVSIQDRDIQFLSANDTSFMLSAKEAAQIRTVFEPHGLRIRETDS